MLTMSAVHRPLLDQVCCRNRIDDFSVRASNWHRHELSGEEGAVCRCPMPEIDGSDGADACGVEWPTIPAEWRSRPRQQPSPKGTFLPRTELGRKLWELRQKYLADGGRLSTVEEIASELERRQQGLE